MSSSNEREDQAIKTAMKEERARDAKRAMQEYEAEKAAVRAKTARLRALRLANEARNPPQEKTKKKAKKDQ